MNTRVGNTVLKDKKTIGDTEKDRDPRNMGRKSPCQILWLQILSLQGSVRLSHRPLEWKNCETETAVTSTESTARETVRQRNSIHI